MLCASTFPDLKRTRQQRPVQRREALEPKPALPPTHALASALAWTASRHDTTGQLRPPPRGAWTRIQPCSCPSGAHAEPRLRFFHAAALRVELRGGLAEEVAPQRRAVHARLRARRRAEGSGLLARARARARPLGGRARRQEDTL